MASATVEPKTPFSKRNWQAKKSRAEQVAVSDIGDIPPIVNEQRKAECGESLELFLQQYFPNSTGISPFSDDHKRVIARMQNCILRGGRQVNAVYRGFAKTSISTNAAIWAVGYGYRRYVAVFSANEPQAQDIIAAIKTELSENDLLYEDFPEICHAFRALEGKPQRCGSQSCGFIRCPSCIGKPEKQDDCGLCKGAGEIPHLTHIGYRADRVIMPNLPGSKAAGAILASRGMTGSGTRGLLHTMPNGIKQRPDFTIVDDPQTVETASTGAQVKKRIDIIKRDIMRLAPHSSPMSMIVNATVIAPDDLVEQLFDSKRNPAWQGERIKMVRRWANAHETLWLGIADGFSGESYAGIRNSWNRDDPHDRDRAVEASTRFYEANREAMDAGCEVSWSSCYAEGELSAIQHAYNFYIDDGAEIFATECQNEPIVNNEADGQFLSAQQIQGKINGYDRGHFPTAATTLTGFIDVQQDALFWAVCGWEPDFTGYVVDYGAWPQQNRSYFNYRDLRHTIAMRYPNMGTEASIMAALNEFTDNLFGRVFRRDDGAVIPLSRLLVDSGWQSETVYSFTRQSKHKASILPSKGRGISASNVPFSDYKAKPGEKLGENWKIQPLVSNRAIRLCEYDANAWKTFIQMRLATAIGDAGCLSLFKATHYDHRMIAEHLTAEAPIKTEGRGRQLWEWKLPANKPDNHLLDCVVGSAVAASIEGIVVKERAGAQKARRERTTMSFAEMRKR